MSNPVVRKAKVGYSVLKKEGLLGLMIVGLQFLQKKLRPGQDTKESPSLNPIYYKVEYREVLNADIQKPPPRWRGTDKERLDLNWVLPPPGKGSGGHMDIFRYIKALESAGHNCTIYIYSYENPATIAEVKAEMGHSYPEVKAEMLWLRRNRMRRADAIFATSWDTAYPVYNDPSNAKRFYLIQDFEPYFYHVGGLSVLAENTYRFGFYGITLGPWVSKMVKPYGMKTDYLDIGADNSTYKLLNDEKRKEILFYARPLTGRRGFEVGILALDLFHKKHPDYKINMLGYDVSGYDIPFPYNNLKILEHDELNELYNRCAAGLVMSLTNMSLLPLELLACGTIPVVNDGENNRMVSDNKFIEYSQADPHSLSRKLSEVVIKRSSVSYARQASGSVEGLDWKKSCDKLVKIVERETRKVG